MSFLKTVLEFLAELFKAFNDQRLEDAGRAKERAKINQDALDKIKAANIAGDAVDFSGDPDGLLDSRNRDNHGR